MLCYEPSVAKSNQVVQSLLGENHVSSTENSCSLPSYFGLAASGAVSPPPEPAGGCSGPAAAARTPGSAGSGPGWQGVDPHARRPSGVPRRRAPAALDTTPFALCFPPHDIPPLPPLSVIVFMQPHRPTNINI